MHFSIFTENVVDFMLICWCCCCWPATKNFANCYLVQQATRIVDRTRVPYVILIILHTLSTFQKGLPLCFDYWVVRVKWHKALASDKCCNNISPPLRQWTTVWGETLRKRSLEMKSFSTHKHTRTQTAFSINRFSRLPHSLTHLEEDATCAVPNNQHGSLRTSHAQCIYKVFQGMNTNDQQ